MNSPAPAPFPARLLAALALLATSAAADPNPVFDPKPAEGDFSLPMPGGLKMVFRPVFLGVGGKDFMGKKLTLGDRVTGGYKEYPTTVVIGGSFLKEPAAGAETDWMFYIGKYEVSAAQYAAVMDAANPPAKGGLPAVDVTLTEVRQFLSAYNRWLYENAPDALPKNESRSGYLRLPTEGEWEFTARGGAAVEKDIFDLVHPYGKNLLRHEWASGPKSSYDKLKEIGTCNPNPLGVHDLLGNVSEMTESLYQVEYIQGRIGGYVIRGGSFYTPEKKMRSSMRSEVAFYNEKLQEHKQGDLGFRLLIASPIYSSMQTGKRMEAAWEPYKKSRLILEVDGGVINPNFKLADAVAHLQRLEAEIGRTGTATPEVLAQMGLLKSSFDDVESLIRNAQRDSARAWARVASSTGIFMVQLYAKLEDAEKLVQGARDVGHKNLKEYELKLSNHKANIRDVEERYCEVMQELEKLPPALVREGFELYLKVLIRKRAEPYGAGLEDHIKLYHPIVVGHYEEYARDKRLNMEVWREQFKPKLKTP